MVAGARTIISAVYYNNEPPRGMRSARRKIISMHLQLASRPAQHDPAIRGVQPDALEVFALLDRGRVGAAVSAQR